MNTDYTHISFVLDRSGSMSAMRADAIGGFNVFLRDQQAASGKATLTLAQFNNQYEIVHDFAPLASAAPLSEKTFVPSGGTALLDAIGRTIDGTGAKLAAMPESERPGKVLCVILTDGEENASHVFTRVQVMEKITHQRDVYDWVFVFLAANQDAIQTGQSLGIAAESSATYAASGAGQQAAMRGVSQAVRKMRAEGQREYSLRKSAGAFDAEDRAVVEKTESPKK